MKKTLTMMLAAITLVVSLATISTDANAWHRSWHRPGGGGGGVAAGIIGGIAAGAIIGTALTARPAYAYPAYRPAAGYVAYSGYYGAAPVACPGGYWGRRPTAVNRFGEPIRWSRVRFFCP